MGGVTFRYVVPPRGTGGGGTGDVTGPAGAVNNDIAVFNGVTGKIIKDGGFTIAQVIAAAIAGSGDVVGPAGATDNAVARYDGATGKLIQESTAILSDSGVFSINVNDGGNPVFTCQLTNNAAVQGAQNGVLFYAPFEIDANGRNWANNTNLRAIGDFCIFSSTSFNTLPTSDRVAFCSSNAGNIGIGFGTPNPSYSLHVSPTIAPAGQTALFIDNTPTTGITGIFFNAGAAQSTNPVLTVQGSNSIQAAGTVKGTLTTLTNAATGLTPGVLAATTNASIVITDGTGQVYRVPCII